MKPRGSLMIEHRLIEKMFKRVETEIDRIRNEETANPVFIDTMVDFIRTYADLTHHGKEEDILFRDLAAKQMSNEDDRIMQELIEEHKYGRNTVKELVEAKDRYLLGDANALQTVVGKLGAWAEFYARHIEKEDKVFFPSTEHYFSQAELDDMLAEFWELDRKMIHEKYKAVVEQLSHE